MKLEILKGSDGFSVVEMYPNDYGKSLAVFVSREDAELFVWAKTPQKAVINFPGPEHKAELKKAMASCAVGPMMSLPRQETSPIVLYVEKPKSPIDFEVLRVHAQNVQRRAGRKVIMVPLDDAGQRFAAQRSLLLEQACIVAVEYLMADRSKKAAEIVAQCEEALHGTIGDAFGRDVFQAEYQNEPFIATEWNSSIPSSVRAALHDSASRAPEATNNQLETKPLSPMIATGWSSGGATDIKSSLLKAARLIREGEKSQPFADAMSPILDLEATLWAAREVNDAARQWMKVGADARMKVAVGGTATLISEETATVNGDTRPVYHFEKSQTCTCKSLLNGHENDCPLAEK